MESPELARPFAPHRQRTYIGLLSVVGFVFVFMTIAEATGLLPPTLAVDVAANLIFGIPVLLLPLILFWKARGEQRSRLQLAAELTLVYIPLTAGSQLTYELPFLLGHPFNLWTATTHPGWRWLWWQYGMADTRYRSDDPWIFGLEFAAVPVGIMLTIAWLRLLRKGLSDESRIKCLWLIFFGVAELLTGTVVYYVSEIRAGFHDIGQGAYGLWFKLVGENVPYMILPVFVLYAVYLQVDYLTRRAGAAAAVSAQTEPAASDEAFRYVGTLAR
jgi:hypothetical protein